MLTFLPSFFYTVNQSGGVALIDLVSGESVATVHTHSGARVGAASASTGRATCVSFTNDGEALLTAGEEGVICIWSLPTAVQQMIQRQLSVQASSASLGNCKQTWADSSSASRVASSDRHPEETVGVLGLLGVTGLAPSVPVEEKKQEIEPAVFVSRTEGDEFEASEQQQPGAADEAQAEGLEREAVASLATKTQIESYSEPPVSPGGPSALFASLSAQALRPLSPMLSPVPRMRSPSLSDLGAGGFGGIGESMEDDSVVRHSVTRIMPRVPNASHVPSLPDPLTSSPHSTPQSPTVSGGIGEMSSLGMMSVGSFDLDEQDSVVRNSVTRIMPRPPNNPHTLNHSNGNPPRHSSFESGRIGESPYPYLNSSVVGKALMSRVETVELSKHGVVRQKSSDPEQKELVAVAAESDSDSDDEGSGIYNRCQDVLDNLQDALGDAVLVFRDLQILRARRQREAARQHSMKSHPPLDDLALTRPQKPVRDRKVEESDSVDVTWLRQLSEKESSQLQLTYLNTFTHLSNQLSRHEAQNHLSPDHKTKEKLDNSESRSRQSEMNTEHNDSLNISHSITEWPTDLKFWQPPR